MDVSSYRQVRLLWSVKDTANALGMSHWTVRFYTRSGQLRSVRIGRRVMVDPDDVIRLIEAGRTPETEVNVRLVRKVASQDGRVAIHA
jgi:hypothetical protein